MSVRRLELLVSTLLRGGVIISGAFMLLGLTLLWLSGDVSQSFGVLTLDWLFLGDPFLEPSHILFLGFLVLVATPIMRVAASIVAYIYDKDWAYTAITGMVLLILMAGMVLGLG